MKKTVPEFGNFDFYILVLSHVAVNFNLLHSCVLTPLQQEEK